jgi:hypothetical protein
VSHLPPVALVGQAVMCRCAPEFPAVGPAGLSPSNPVPPLVALVVQSALVWALVRLERVARPRFQLAGRRVALVALCCCLVERAAKMAATFVSPVAWVGYQLVEQCN